MQIDKKLKHYAHLYAYRATLGGCKATDPNRKLLNASGWAELNREQTEKRLLATAIKFTSLN